MRLGLTGRNLTITPAFRQVVTRRLEKPDRLSDRMHVLVRSADGHIGLLDADA